MVLLTIVLVGALCFWLGAEAHQTLIASEGKLSDSESIKKYHAEDLSVRKVGGHIEIKDKDEIILLALRHFSDVVLDKDGEWYEVSLEDYYFPFDSFEEAKDFYDKLARVLEMFPVQNNIIVKSEE